jgi:hypothetical protein
MPKSSRTPRRGSRKASASGTRTNTRLLAGVQQGLVRCRVTGSGAVTIKANNLAGAMGCIATSTTALRTTAAAVKVSHVKLIIPPPSSGDVNSGRLTWNGGGSNEARSSFIASTNNPAKCALVSTKPPKESAAAFWVDDSSALMTVHAPVGTIVELSITIRHARPGQAGFVPDVVVAGLTTGDTYYAAVATSLLTIDDGN